MKSLTRLATGGTATAKSFNWSFNWPATKGMVLLLSLAMLAGLSLLAVLAANSMLQQRLMASNHSDGELARLSAITAVAAGEAFLFGLALDSREESCRADCYAETVRSYIHAPGSLPKYPEFLADDWWLQWGQGFDTTLDSGKMSESRSGWVLPGRQSPRFVVEEVEYQITDSTSQPPEAPAINGVAYYRILGWGTGVASGNTHVMESIIARPWLASSSNSEDAGINCRTFRPWYDCGRMAFREKR